MASLATWSWALSIAAVGVSAAPLNNNSTSNCTAFKDQFWRHRPTACHNMTLDFALQARKDTVADNAPVINDPQHIPWAAVQVYRFYPDCFLYCTDDQTSVAQCTDVCADIKQHMYDNIFPNTTTVKQDEVDIAAGEPSTMEDDPNSTMILDATKKPMPAPLLRIIRAFDMYYPPCTNFCGERHEGEEACPPICAGVRHALYQNVWLKFGKNLPTITTSTCTPTETEKPAPTHKPIHTDPEPTKSPDAPAKTSKTHTLTCATKGPNGLWQTFPCSTDLTFPHSSKTLKPDALERQYTSTTPTTKSKLYTIETAPPFPSPTTAPTKPSMTMPPLPITTLDISETDSTDDIFTIETAPPFQSLDTSLPYPTPTLDAPHPDTINKILTIETAPAFESLMTSLPYPLPTLDASNPDAADDIFTIKTIHASESPMTSLPYPTPTIDNDQLYPTV